ncbi:hypothetical protein ACKWTF_000377 [Chironomus riparius]
MCAVYDSVIKDFQCNLSNFVHSVENMAISTKNIAQIMNHVDPSTSINKSYIALLEWSQNLFMLAERFEADFKSQLTNCIDKEIAQPESCTIRMTMGNIYEKYLFFLNHLAHSLIDIDEQSPLSASNVDCQSSASAPQNSQAALQRFRLQQQSYRRWSEANAMENNKNSESNFDINRRWSMPTPTNVNKNRMNVIPKLAGLVGQTVQQQQQLSQSSNNDSSDEWAAIQLLSLRPPIPSRPVSQMQHNLQPIQYQVRNTQPQQASRSQRQSRGELNEILILPRPNDSLFLGRCQQIAENIRGESDEY